MKEKRLSEKKLKSWRKDALEPFDEKLYEGSTAEYLAAAYAGSKERILVLTQELFDQHLLRKK